MTHRESDLQVSGISSENFTIPTNPSFSYYQPRSVLPHRMRER